MGAPSGQIWAQKSPETQPTNFATVQSALDWCNTPGGKVFVPPGTYTGNFTVYGKTMIEGCGALTTLFQAASSASPVFREKTAGEGNTSGAAGIVCSKFGVYGNGSTGDGINFGNQGGAQFTSNATLIDILSRDFLSGTGIILNANSIHLRDIWCANCSVGMNLGGGSSQVTGGWFEGCSTTCLDITSAWNKFYGIHLECSGFSPSKALMYVENGRNRFDGIDILLDRNMTNNLIVEKAGASNIRYDHVIVNGAFTWTNTIYNETWTNGSGALDYIPFVIDNANSEKGFIRDHSNNFWLPVGPGVQGLQRQAAGASMTAASTISPDVYGSFYWVTGSTTIDNITANVRDKGRIIVLQTLAAPTIKHNSGGTGNIRCTGGVDLAMTANDIVAFVCDNNGNIWWQMSPAVPFP